MTGPSDATTLPSFVHPLSSGCTDVDYDAELPREEQAEVDRRCEELAVHRAQAEVSSRGYLIR